MGLDLLFKDLTYIANLDPKFKPPMFPVSSVALKIVDLRMRHSMSWWTSCPMIQSEPSSCQSLLGRSVGLDIQGIKITLRRSIYYLHMFQGRSLSTLLKIWMVKWTKLQASHLCLVLNPDLFFIDIVYSSLRHHWVSWNEARLQRLLRKSCRERPY